MSYLLSIVIPTRNRLQYLKECIASINGINNEELEVIVQDNSDNHDEVETFIKSFNNDNIKYFYCGEKLSQTENSDLALSHASGEYITYIGDDDTICKTMIDVAKEMSLHKIDACKYGITTYNWPDLMEKVEGLVAYSSPHCIGEIWSIKSTDVLEEVLSEGVQDITMLPRVYHGLVSKRLLDEIYESIGTYFPGPSPDMANAVSCALLAKNQIGIDIPLIISGYGGSSAGGLGKRKLHKGKLKGNFQLRNDVEDKWPNKVPKLWMGCTMWPSSAISALNAFGRQDLINKVNYGEIYGEAILKDHSCIGEIISCHPTFKEYLTMTKHVNKRVLGKIRSNSPKQINDVVKEKMSLMEAFDRQNKSNARFDISELMLNYVRSIEE